MRQFNRNIKSEWFRGVKLFSIDFFIFIQIYNIGHFLTEYLNFEKKNYSTSFLHILTSRSANTQ